jgi:hypothetical protein
MVLRGLTSILCALALGAGVSVFPHSATPVAGAAAAAPLPFFYDLYTFRDDGGGTAIVAAIALEAGSLRRVRRGDQVRYRFDLRFELADTVRRTMVRSVDSVFVSLSYDLPGDHLLHTYVEVASPPSVSTVQRVVVTDPSRPGVGQLYQSPITVPDYSGDELMLSDIAFGLPDASEGWLRRGHTLALLPTSQFPESAFDVYYEIYNLRSGSPYETEIAIAPLDRDDVEGVSARAVFRGEATSELDGSLGELRRVESALPEGRFRLTVTVRDQLTGRSAARSRTIEVRGWGDGMTLVQALPRMGTPVS